MIRSFYAVRRNLLLRFKDDSIDETLPLAVLLQVRRGCSCDGGAARRRGGPHHGSLTAPPRWRARAGGTPDSAAPAACAAWRPPRPRTAQGRPRPGPAAATSRPLTPLSETPPDPQSSSAIDSSLDVSVRTLPGDHIRPMQQSVLDLPPELARAANQGMAQGGQLLGGSRRQSRARPRVVCAGGGGKFAPLPCVWPVPSPSPWLGPIPLSNPRRGLFALRNTPPPGRLADMATQAGLQSASAPLEDLRKGLGSLAEMLGGEVGLRRGCRRRPGGLPGRVAHAASRAAVNASVKPYQTPVLEPPPPRRPAARWRTACRPLPTRWRRGCPSAAWSRRGQRRCPPRSWWSAPALAAGRPPSRRSGALWVDCVLGKLQPCTGEGPSPCFAMCVRV